MISSRSRLVGNCLDVIFLFKDTRSNHYTTIKPRDGNNYRGDRSTFVLLKIEESSCKDKVGKIESVFPGQSWLKKVRTVNLSSVSVNNLSKSVTNNDSGLNKFANKWPFHVGEEKFYV